MKNKVFTEDAVRFLVERDIVHPPSVSDKFGRGKFDVEELMVDFCNEVLDRPKPVTAEQMYRLLSERSDFWVDFENAKFKAKSFTIVNGEVHFYSVFHGADRQILQGDVVLIGGEKYFIEES